MSISAHLGPSRLGAQCSHEGFVYKVRAGIDGKRSYDAGRKAAVEATPAICVVYTSRHRLNGLARLIKGLDHDSILDVIKWHSEEPERQRPQPASKESFNTSTHLELEGYKC